MRRPISEYLKSGFTGEMTKHPHLIKIVFKEINSVLQLIVTLQRVLKKKRGGEGIDHPNVMRLRMLFK